VTRRSREEHSALSAGQAIPRRFRSQMQLVVLAVTAQASGFDEKLADLKASLGERIAATSQLSNLFP